MERNIAETVVKVYAWIQWVSGALGIAFGLMLLLAPGAFAGAFDESPVLGTLFSGIGIGAGVVLIAMGLFDIVVGAGLWQRRNWARIAMIVIGVLSLLSFPFGTIYGLITIFLFAIEDGVKSVFIKPVDAVRVERRKKVRA